MKNILGLPELKVNKILEDTEGRSIKAIAEIEERPYCCTACGSVNAPHKHDSKNRLVKDLPISGKLVYIELKVQRYKCVDCKSVTSDKFSFIDEGTQMTKRLRVKITDRVLHGETYKGIGDDYSISDKGVRAIFDEYVKRNEQMLCYKAPRVLGLDEAHIDKHFRLIVTDIENRKLLDMLPDNSYNTVTRLLKSLENKESIVVATMDFAPVYAKAVSDVLPKVVIVIDHFHVIQDINKKIDRVRVDLHNKAKKDGNEIKRLRNEHTLFKTNFEDLTDEQCQRLSDWFKEYPKLESVYMFKEQFREIYAKAETKFEASQMFDKWYQSIPKDIPELVSLGKYFKQRKNHILNFFDYRWTNAYTESVNNLIKKIEKSGNGYKFEVLRARALFSTKATKPPKFAYKDATYGLSGNFMLKHKLKRKKTLVEGFNVDIDKLLKYLD